LLKVVLNTKIKSIVKIINFKNFFKHQIAIIVQLRTDGQMCFSMDFALAIQIPYCVITSYPLFIIALPITSICKKFK
jgi:hypothetical protein